MKYEYLYWEKTLTEHIDAKDEIFIALKNIIV